MLRTLSRRYPWDTAISLGTPAHAQSPPWEVTIDQLSPEGEGHHCQFVFAYWVLSVMSVQSFCGKDKDFVVKTKDFVVKMQDFWWRQRIFYFFFIFAKNPSSLPHSLQCFTLHTNEGSHLHWACADILMRESPLLSMCKCCTEHVQT